MNSKQSLAYTNNTISITLSIHTS